MNKAKLRSFINVSKRECIATVLLIDHFEEFMSSDFDDAYDFFCSKGMIQTEQINDIRICKWIAEAHEEVPSVSFEGLIGLVMKKSKGRLDPNKVRDIVIEFFKG